MLTYEDIKFVDNLYYEFGKLWLETQQENIVYVIHFGMDNAKIREHLELILFWRDFVHNTKSAIDPALAQNIVFIQKIRL